MSITLADHGADAVITCAGHPLPVLVPADGPSLYVVAPGQLLGVLPNVELHPVAETLRHGDTLVMYTDGISDVPPPHGYTDPTALLEAAFDELRSALGP